MVRSPAQSEHGRVLLGIALAVVSASAFTASTVATVWSYDGGAEPLAAITIRFAGAIVVLVALMKAFGVPLGLPPRRRYLALGLGCILSIQSWCLYNSFFHIPVGLTFTIFYVYPILVTMIAIGFGQDRLTVAVAAALAIAFCGLILVFNVTGEGMDPLGAGLAIGASVAWSIVMVASARVMRGHDARSVTLHMQVSAGVIYAAICLIDGAVVLPETAKGWTGYLALPVFYAAATVCLFASIARIGSVRAALVMNLEPVFTIAAGFLLLGQGLSGQQLLGAALVIAAVFAVRLRRPEPG